MAAAALALVSALAVALALAPGLALAGCASAIDLVKLSEGYNDCTVGPRPRPARAGGRRPRM